MPKKQRPCPFCQHGELRVHKVEGLDADYFAVQCLNCSAEGPHAITENAAWKRWEMNEPRHIMSIENGMNIDCVCGETMKRGRRQVV